MDRQIHGASRYGTRRAQIRAGEQAMATDSKESMTAQIFEVYIRAPAETIWDAITSPEWTAKYGYRAPMNYELSPQGTYRCRATAQMRQMGLPDIIIDGEVIESQPPRKLVQTYRFLFTEQTKAEGFTRVTWDIVP